MQKKNVLLSIGISALSFSLLVFWLYEGRFTWMSVSNILFLLGLIFFFLGLIIATNATRIFSSGDYILRKSFTSAKKMEHFFKSYHEYLVYKQEKRIRNKTTGLGIFLLSLGAFYILSSILIGLKA